MANYDYIEETGTIIPQTSNILGETQQEYKEVFGDDLNVAPSTRQGRLIAAETLSRSSVVRNNAALANQINPNLSGGIALDAIIALTNPEGRDSASSTFVASVDLAGVPGTIIPALSVAQTPAGDRFVSLTTVTLDVGGNATVDFQSEVEGPIPCGIGQLTSIVDGPLGWETVNNTIAGVLGTDRQSDVSAKRVRRNTLATQGTALSEAIISGLSNPLITPGVRSVAFRENPTDAPVIIDNVNLVANSIWACVDGGTDIDIANTLLNRKNGGCNYNGSVVVNDVVDPSSGQLYDISFERPTDVPVIVRATVQVNEALQDPETEVRQAILDYANQLLPNFDGFVVGNNVSPFQISGAVTQEVSGIFVAMMEVSLAAPVSWQTTEIPLEIFEQASIGSNDITVIVL